jgi:hypothetical protein
MQKAELYLQPVTTWFKNTFDTDNKLYGLYAVSGATLVGAGSYYYYTKKSKSTSVANTPKDESSECSDDEES